MSFFDLLAYTVAIIGTGISAYFDLKTTYIPDEITHAMIVIGALLLFFRFPVLTALTYLGIGVLIFVIGFIVYSFGQIGGGDVKLYTALALLIPTFKPLLNVPTPPYPPIVSIFFASAVLGVAFISLKYIHLILRDRNKIPNFNRKFVVSLFLSGLTFAVSILMSLVIPGIALILIAISLGMFVYPFKDDLMSLYVVEKKKVQDLTEDDIIAIDRLDPKIVKNLGLGLKRTYLSFELDKIKSNASKHNIEYVPVYEHLPTFGIYIFLGLLVTLVVGDLMFFLFTYL